MKPNEPKRHHWIPRFYLEYFATPDPPSVKQRKIWCFPRGEVTREEFLTGTHNIAVEKDLYTIDLGGNKNTKLETDLAVLEGLVSQVWPALAQDYFDFNRSPAYKKTFSLFLATLIVRHPRNQALSVDIHRNTVSSFAKSKSPQLTLFQEPEEFEQYAESSEREIWNQYLVSFKSKAMDLAQALRAKRWSVIQFEEPLLVTSDNPVIIINDTGKGISLPDTTIVLPISPTRAFWIDDLVSEPEWQIYPQPAELARLLNYYQLTAEIRHLLSPRAIPDVLMEIHLTIKKHGL